MNLLLDEPLVIKVLIAIYLVWMISCVDRTLGRHSCCTLDRLYGQYQLHRLPNTDAWSR